MEQVVNNAPMTEGEEATTLPVEESTKVETTQVPGSKTDSALLLESLREEREKRRKLEEELQVLRNPTEADAYSEEGLLLKQRIDSLESQLKLAEEEKITASVLSKFPAIKDKITEFNEFKKDYPVEKLESVAKLFLVENDLLDTATPRKGLERATGGTRNQAPSKMTSEDIKNLRENNFRQYSKLLREGKIQS